MTVAPLIGTAARAPHPTPAANRLPAGHGFSAAGSTGGQRMPRVSRGGWDVPGKDVRGGVRDVPAPQGSAVLRSPAAAPARDAPRLLLAAKRHLITVSTPVPQRANCSLLSPKMGWGRPGLRAVFRQGFSIRREGQISRELATIARVSAASLGFNRRLNPCSKLPKVFVVRKKQRLKIPSVHNCGHWNRVLNALGVSRATLSFPKVTHVQNHPSETAAKAILDLARSCSFSFPSSWQNESARIKLKKTTVRLCFKLALIYKAQTAPLSKLCPLIY